MSRIETVNQRYVAAARLTQSGVEIVAVGDPAGARLNAAVRQLLLHMRDDGPGLWDDLVGAAKSLRWRLMTQPVPAELSPTLREGVNHVARQIQRLRGAVSNEALLDELAVATEEVSKSDSTVGVVLRESIQEIGATDCVVIAASKPAQASLEEWLNDLRVPVLTVGDLRCEQTRVEQAYVVGPPRLFSASIVTAPLTDAVTFLLPAWFRDRSIPRSAMAPYAEGALWVDARLFTEGDTKEPEGNLADEEVEDDYLPQPAWGTWQSQDREPTNEEVVARKVLLSGYLAMWLDDGERIRALDPDQPAGERVIYADIATVQPGAYLLVRQGETEQGALHQAALGLLGERGKAAAATQRIWKEQLSNRLTVYGYRAVVRALRKQGVKAADRARAWAEPSLVRPHSDHDFETLLQWLGIEVQPTFGHATMLRRTLHKASTDVQKQLEMAVSAADLSVLQRDGHLSLEAGTSGFRGITATRVLAVSPFTTIVPKHDARVPFRDRSGQWLE